ncbi:hypothetical protein TeGR_g14914 [Tetraparma gracilis]|nr:hypothetical protein TeGR_g14914 [Tetraparma gracilis]
MTSILADTLPFADSDCHLPSFPPRLLHARVPLDASPTVSQLEAASGVPRRTLNAQSFGTPPPLVQLAAGSFLRKRPGLGKPPNGRRAVVDVYLNGNFDALNVLYESFPHHLLYNGV